MSECEQHIAPQFSVVIPVYNDWIPLEKCLQSLCEQKGGPSFEVIVVDDGSDQASPDSVLSTTYPSLWLRIIHQKHSGIPSARNRGIANSKGNVLLFVDADCRLKTGCLAALNTAISQSPQRDCFQLRLVGDGSTLVGRGEELRLSTFQRLMLRPDGRIQYLNTAGFAIRKRRAEAGEIFHPGALRGEDTLLLAELMQAGELPLFVGDAVVQHSIPLSLMKCLRKDVRSVYLEGAAYEMIAVKGVQIRLTNRERLRLLGSMWRAAKHSSLGASAWLVVVIRQALQRTASYGFGLLRLATGSLRKQL